MFCINKIFYWIYDDFEKVYIKSTENFIKDVLKEKEKKKKKQSRLKYWNILSHHYCRKVYYNFLDIFFSEVYLVLKIPALIGCAVNHYCRRKGIICYFVFCFFNFQSIFSHKSIFTFFFLLITVDRLYITLSTFDQELEFLNLFFRAGHLL